jgi:predicted nucleotidyltransferase
MKNLNDRIEIIKNAILNNVQAKYIYLFGSYAYGEPTEDSDIDIYTVIPDEIDSVPNLYGDIIGDIGDYDIYDVDLKLQKESAFNEKKDGSLFLETIIQKGRLLYVK